MRKVIWALAASWLFSSFSWAAPPHPKLVERLKEEGKWEEFKAKYKSWGDYDQPNPNPYRFTFTPPMASGAVPPDTIKVVIIYAAPSDRPISSDGLTVTQAQLQTILFGANPTGSMTDYYREVSYGQTVVVGNVHGPFTLPQTNAFYTFGGSGLPATDFVNDALTAADPTVDFSQYDYNNNGVIDGLFVIHSGPGAEETGSPNDIWSHASGISRVLDGKSINNYAIQPEQQSTPASPIQIGVFCHESGHSLMGLPDLYDTDGSSEGVGEWCLMGSGNYRNGSRTPVHYSAWCKKRIGWLTMTNVAANQNNVSFPTSQYTPTAYRLWTNGSTGSSQFFLVENRIKRGFDSFLPGNGGLLIWHIDEGVSGNSNENRYLVGLEQADGLAQLNLGSNRGDGGDPYPGSSDNRNFDEFSNPNSRANITNAATKVAVFNISDLDSVMTADLEVTYGRPKVVSSVPSINDAAGNGNGLPEPGETINLFLSFTNAWLATTNWNVRVRANDLNLTFTDSSAFIANLPGLGAATSTSPDAITYSVPSNFGRSRLDTFFVNAWNFDSSHTFTASWVQQIGPTQMLLVDDDHNRALETYYKSPFDTLLYPTATWTVVSQGVPSAANLSAYPHIFWFTGNDSVSLLNPARIASLSAYMNAGGNVVLSGQGIAQSLAGGADSAFLLSYFHTRYKASQGPPIYAVGVPGNAISNGLQAVVIASGGAANQTQPDQLDLTDGRAEKIFTYSNAPNVTTGPIGAVAYADSIYRALFAGFGLEAINSNAAVQGGAKRSVIFSKILDWLESSTATQLPIPFITLDASAYSFAASASAPLPAPETLLVENSGGGSLSWTATLNPSVPWLAVTPPSGTAPSAPEIAITSTALPPGTYADTVVITAAGAHNTPQKVTVTYTVFSIRGDLSSDGILNPSDIVLLLNCVYVDMSPGNCAQAVADINCDAMLTPSDIVILLNEVFLGSTPPC